MNTSMPSDIDLSIAQVEAELRAAEAYLTTAARSARREAAAGSALPQDASLYERVRQPLAESESAFFKRPARARTPIPEERRREILAKLSSERGNPRVATPSVRDTTSSMHHSERDEHEELAGSGHAVPIHADIVDGDEPYDDGGEGDLDGLNRPHLYYHNDSHYREDVGDEDEDDCVDEDGDGEVFYASDVIGKSIHEPVQPRTALDLFSGDPNEDYEDKETDPRFNTRATSDDDGDVHYELTETVPTNYRPVERGYDLEQSNGDLAPTSASIFSKVLARREDWYKEADMHISQLLSPTSQRPEATTEFAAHESSSRDVDDEDFGRQLQEQYQAPNIGDERLSGYPNENVDSFSGGDEIFMHKNPTAVRSRLETLSQPRTRVFAAREKQRLLNEIQALKECTFQPVVRCAAKSTKPTPPNSLIDATRTRQTKSVRFDMSSEDAGGAFPWLTLSPRKGSASRKPRKRSQALIDRLNLDVTAKYEARERLREMLEAEKMRECTFQPKINPVSKRLLSRTDYKPIHERAGEIQREKVEYIQRIREELAYEEGAFTFTPQINPRSRQIAEAVLTEKQVSKIRASAQAIDLNDERKLKAMIRPPVVTDRLVEDAEHVAEKRLAAQEYYDALEEKAFVPTISEISNRLLLERPEFKLDFVSRQEYFRMVEQEKLEALEDVVHHEQQLTFRPNIGNADKVLREMRPDLVQETAQQRLDRLIYHEPRLNEMRKQRLREEAHAKLSFKPEINSVSKALAEKAKADVMSNSTRRHELQRFFDGKHFRSRVAKELEQAEKAECTFRPQLVARPKVKSSSTSKLQVKERQVWRSDTILHTIETQRQQRAETLEAKRNELELKELENCTFQPNTHRPPRRALSESYKRAEKPVVVRGLGRFLELKERAKRQEEERKLREEKVFNPNHAYEPRSYTVPKPFKLSESSKDSIRRRLKLREEMRAKERTECTFAPRTLEAQQRQVLRAMLKD